ncbi:hypothetical protein TWF173_001669 [Orbilia oligospora]|nr:hypothetical protein TWF173_001669 [Orbilia oligospora]
MQNPLSSSQQERETFRLGQLQLGSYFGSSTLEPGTSHSKRAAGVLSGRRSRMRDKRDSAGVGLAWLIWSGFGFGGRGTRKFVQLATAAVWFSTFACLCL